MHANNLILSVAAVTIGVSVPAQGPQPFVWNQINSPQPLGRVSLTLTYCRAEARSVLFGGWNDATGELGDTWEYQSTAGVWTRYSPASAPCPRDSHAAVYDSARGRVILFGGRDGAGSLNDMWEYDCATHTWAQIVAQNTPPARYGHTMVYDSRRDKLVLFGGATTPFSFLGGTWEYDCATAAWQQVQVQGGPSARLLQAMAYDPASGRAVMFGGSQHAVTNLADTWEYSGSTQTWAQVQVASPPAGRCAYGIAYDAVRGVAVMFGGSPGSQKGGRLGDTWEYEFLTHRWTQTTPTSSPTGRVAHAPAYDESVQSTILFGGGDNITIQYFDETWEYASTRVELFGAPTPHCSGAPGIHTLGNPITGNNNFGVRVSNGLLTVPGLADGFMLVSLFPGSGSLACSQAAGSLSLNVLPSPFSPLWVVSPLTIGSDGEGRWPLPLPGGPVLRGLTVVMQFYQNHASWGCPCLVYAGVGGSASRGLRITIY